MYLQILKKDLKRKKTMNVILLLFIALASMFVAGSVNNIVSVTSALDDYFEMADVPDYFAGTLNKSTDINLDDILANAKALDSYRCEKILYMTRSNVQHDGASIELTSNTYVIQGDNDLSLNYFLDDNSILREVGRGQVYMTANAFEKAKLKVGDIITIELGKTRKDFTVAGEIKDAVLGSNQLDITRFIINREDFGDYIAQEDTNKLFGGLFIYMKTSDTDTMLTSIPEAVDNFSFTMDRTGMRFTYIFDMIVSGILLVVSLILIAIAFVVLRFTITFTLSEEFREIGVMKAIGIGNIKIRGLYLVKYAVLSVSGSVIGLTCSYPFSSLLMSVSSKSVIIENGNPYLTNIVCAALVVAVILLFCFGCTGKVKKYTPIDAIRNGQTGERFRKKSLLNLGSSKMRTTAFLSLNDVVSSPRRYGIITLTFTLCLSLILILSATVTTLKSKKLISTFGMTQCDTLISLGDTAMSFMTENGHEQLKTYLAEAEKTLAENSMPAKCALEIMCTLPVSHNGYESKIPVYQATGTTADMYEYTAGTAPQNNKELAITRIAAAEIKADIGDTITIKTFDGEKQYIITAFFQAMNTQGTLIRLHESDEINYIQASGCMPMQVIFTDNPDDKEIERRIEKLKELYPEPVEVMSCSEWVTLNVGVADALDSVKRLVTLLTIILSALITVLMERSFISKEKGELALLKAVGFRNGRIYSYHTVRFAIVGAVAIIIAEISALPLTHLCIDPIFRMMGMELAMSYELNPLEMYLLLPLAVFATTILSSLVTSLYTRKIKASDTAGIE